MARAAASTSCKLPWGRAHTEVGDSNPPPTDYQTVDANDSQ
jgi:hypothetical protein